MVARREARGAGEDNCAKTERHGPQTEPVFRFTRLPFLCARLYGQFCWHGHAPSCCDLPRNFCACFYSTPACFTGSPQMVRARIALCRQILGSGRPPVSFVGTFTQASPSRTTSLPTEHVHVNRARNLSGISSATRTVTSTSSPIFTGARKFSVCEI